MVVISSEGGRSERWRRRLTGRSVQNDNQYVQTGAQRDEHGHDELSTESVAARLRLLSADK